MDNGANTREMTAGGAARWVVDLHRLTGKEKHSTYSEKSAALLLLRSNYYYLLQRGERGLTGVTSMFCSAWDFIGAR